MFALKIAWHPTFRSTFSSRFRSAKDNERDYEQLSCTCYLSARYGSIIYEFPAKCMFDSKLPGIPNYRRASNNLCVWKHSKGIARSRSNVRAFNQRKWLIWNKNKKHLRTARYDYAMHSMHQKRGCSLGKRSFCSRTRLFLRFALFADIGGIYCFYIDALRKRCYAASDLLQWESPWLHHLFAISASGAHLAKATED